jgi:glycosyltransferase involved in cell wall biosynthesis
MLSICFLTTALHPIGGAEMQVANLAKTLRSRGWNMTVISMLPEGTELATELRSCGVRVETLGMQKGKPRPGAIWRLANLLRAFKPEILHAHMVEANLLARVTRPFAAVPVLVSTAHSIREGGRVYDLAYRLTDVMGDVTTNVSAAAMRRYAHDGLAPEGRLRLVYNGIDVNRFQPNEESRRQMRRALAISNEFVWLAIGGLRDVKDYPTMLRAFAGVQGATLLIAGDGERRATLEQLAAELNIANKVRFCGFCKNTAELLNAADGFVLSSIFEGLPLVMLEAAATCLPIVATDVGGNPEIVVHGKNGYLAPASDFIALQNAMQTVMGVSELDRLQMGVEGRKLVAARYSLDHVVDEWERLYGEFLARRNIGAFHSRTKTTPLNHLSSD